jgi:hypothetical protein
MKNFNNENEEHAGSIANLLYATPGIHAVRVIEVEGLDYHSPVL